MIKIAYTVGLDTAAGEITETMLGAFASMLYDELSWHFSPAEISITLAPGQNTLVIENASDDQLTAAVQSFADDLWQRGAWKLA